MGRFFNMDNKFFVFMGKVADLCMLNLLCIACCIPVVTAGASLTALYYVTLKMVRNEEAYIFRSFFKSFKENFKQATIINVIMLIVAVLLYLDTNIAGNMGQTTGKILRMIFAVFTLLYVMVLLYVYPVLAKFYNSIKKYIQKCVFNGDTSSSFYIFDVGDLCLSSGNLFYSVISDTDVIDSSVYFVWTGSDRICQFTFLCKNL